MCIMHVLHHCFVVSHCWRHYFRVTCSGWCGTPGSSVVPLLSTSSCDTSGKIPGVTSLFSTAELLAFTQLRILDIVLSVQPQAEQYIPPVFPSNFIKLAYVIWCTRTCTCAVCFSCAGDVVTTFEQCLGSDDFSVVMSALQNLAEFSLLAQRML